VDAVLMVGHNPTLTELANLLCHGVRIDNVPTCGVLRLDYDLRSWSDVPRGSPADWSFDYPKRSTPLERAMPATSEWPLAQSRAWPAPAAMNICAPFH
jgi:hypothetical protein